MLLSNGMGQAGIMLHHQQIEALTLFIVQQTITVGLWEIQATERMKDLLSSGGMEVHGQKETLT